MQSKHLLSTSLFVALFLLFAPAWAQTRTVNGKVTDKQDGSPLIGVSVKVKNSATGTSTDVNGAFTLTVPENASALVFTYIGYTTQEVSIAGKSTVNVSLATDQTTLNEVVVVGYGSQKKSDVTGGVTSLGPKDFNKGVINSPEQLLQGRTAGVQVTPASGDPGAGINIRIRGTTSIRSGNNPLFVIDGVPLDGGNITDGASDFGAGNMSARNPLSFMNPDDIANITVLKDASAAAIYGSRGANGVVLITTKKGTAGSQSLSFSSSLSVANTLKTYDIMNASQYLQQAGNAGADVAVLNRGSNVDWQDEIFRPGVTQNYSLGFGGGNENTLYRFSGSYSDQEGIIENSGLRRFTGRMNTSHELFNDKVKLELQLTASQVDNQYAPLGDDAGFEGNLLGAALQANPTIPIYDASIPGGFTQSSDFRNPAAMLALISDNDRVNKVLGNLGISWNIVKGLQYKVNVGIDNSNATRKTGISRLLHFGGIKDNGRAVLQNREVYSSLIENTLNYNTIFAADHSLDLLGGFSYQKFNSGGFYTQAQYFLTDEVPYVDNFDGVNNDGSNKAFSAGSYRSGTELQSYFGRANYSFRNKYLLTATLRVDGSSKFGKNNKYGYFPSFAAAWRLSEESFIPKDVFTDLKLRVGYGITGNQEFPGGISRAVFETNSSGSLTQRNNPNPDIRWEETAQFGVGVDFDLFNGRLGGNIDYFDKTTSNLLTQVYYAQPAAVDYKWINLPGHIKNTGMEFALTYRALTNTALKWEISGNMTYLENKVTDFGNTIIPTGNIHGQGLTGAYVQRISDGLPLGAFYLPTFAGYDASGLAIYPNDGAFSFAGSALPKYSFGLNNAFSYRNLTFSVFLNGSTGFYIYNNTANALFTKGSLKNGRNVVMGEASSPESALNAPEVSTRFLEKGDFLRISNMNLAYRFPMTGNKYFKGMSLSLTGQNLALFTNYTGVDPEVNTNKARNGVPSLGIDYTSYPTARMFSLGATFDF
ncbi:MAG TPA: SusC/RagA family TonB-linked outer membrane protein [Sphingobacteriaceae bacterium]